MLFRSGGGAAHAAVDRFVNGGIKRCPFETVAVCALLNMNGSLSILGLFSKILMIILSIVGVGVLLVYYVNNRKQMDRSVKTLVFTSIVAPIIWNIIIMVSFFVK